MKVLAQLKFDVELDVPLGTTRDDVNQIFDEVEVNFHYGDKRVRASKEDLVDVDIEI